MSSWIFNRGRAVMCALPVVVCMGILSRWTPYFLARGEYLFDDWLRARCLPQGDAGLTCVVAVDEMSVNREGTWPWPVEKQFALVHAVLKGKPGAVVVDLPSGAGMPLLLHIDNDDTSLVIPYRLSSSSPVVPERDEGPPCSVIPFTTNPWGGDVSYGIECGLPEGISGIPGETGCGFVMLQPDRDGVVRRFHLLCRRGPVPHQCIALAAMKRYLQADDAIVRVIGGAVQGVTLEWKHIPTGPEGDIYPAWFREKGELPVLSAAALLEGEVDPAFFHDRIVYLGITASDCSRWYRTPSSAGMPAALLHATVIENLHSLCYARESRRGRWLGIFLVVFLPPLLAGLWGSQGWRRSRHFLPPLFLLLLGAFASQMLRTTGEMAHVWYSALGVLLTWGVLTLCTQQVG